jgi:putative tryptophan/tyrosine transport system substrate-binding protein
MNRNRFLKTALSTVCLLGLGSGVALAEPLKIAVANFGDHPQLNAAVEGFKAEIVAAGYKDGTDVVFTVDHVNFDATLVPQMLTKIEAEKPALILTVTTPVSQIAKNTLGKSGIPLVFTAVTDPVKAGLVPSWDKGDANMTGASDMQDVAATLTFARKLLPNAKNLGVPFNPGEANDVALVELMKIEAPKQGFTVVEVGIDNANDIAQRISSLAGKADVIYVPGSNLLQPAIAAVASAAMAAKIPIVNTDEGPVKQDIVPASFAMSYDKVGRNAGKIAVRILKGEAPAAIAPSKPAYEDHAATISKKAAAAFGMTIPDSFADCGCQVE